MTTLRTIASVVVTCVLLFLLLASSHAQVETVNTNAKARQSDKVLFERAMKAMNKCEYAAARTLLGSLINSYPESAYVARAKLSIGDAWYAEGALNRAEMEYQDFVTFFPNRPEVAEVQRKIDAIKMKSKI
jgi:outer membrane protein assembly factor BamD